MNSTASNSTHDLKAGVSSALLARCREGDREAQRTLYETCFPRVYRVIERMVGSQDAADVTQDAFIKALTRLDQFHGESKFETWLYRLAVNEALQFLRRQKRRPLSTLEMEPVSRRPAATSRLEDRELLDRALATLEPELRAALLLREVGGMSYEEIADALGIPSGTVGSRLNRARRYMQSALEELGWKP